MPIKFNCKNCYTEITDANLKSPGCAITFDGFICPKCKLIHNTVGEKITKKECDITLPSIEERDDGIYSRIICTECGSLLEGKNQCRLQTGCETSDVAAFCSKCGRVHWPSGEAVHNRPGQRTFFKDGELVNID